MASPALVRGNHSRAFLTLLLLLALIGGELCLAGYTLAGGWGSGGRWGSGGQAGFFATSALALLVATAIQIRAAWALFCQSGSGPALGTILRGGFAGACAAYVLCLLVGPVAGIATLWAGCTALLGSIMLVPLAANPQTLDRWRKLIEARTPRRIGLAVYHAALGLVVAEALLRGYRLLETAEQVRLAAASGPAVRSLTSAGTEQSGTEPAGFQSIGTQRAGTQRAGAGSARPGVLRVAIVDGLSVRDADCEAFFPSPVVSSYAGLEVFRIGGLEVGAPENQLRAELEVRRPDLVLAMISLEHGLKPMPSAASVFDWRSLELAQLLLGLRAATGPGDAASAQADVQDHSEGRRLAICRTPLDERAKAQWQATFAELDTLLAGCSQSRVPVALVVVPEGFQVNRVLCDTLRRRAGYGPKELDLALPQRRLATYAQERQVPLVDLLPYLQSSHDPVYQQVSGGWNERGKAVASRAICGWLASQYSGLSARAQLSSGN